MSPRLSSSEPDHPSADELALALERMRHFNLDVAHDLRGPLGGIGLLALLAQQQIAAGDLAAATLSLQRIGDEVRLSQGELDALLRLADSLERPLAYQDVDLTLLAQAAAAGATMVNEGNLPQRALPRVQVEDLGRAVCDPGLVHVILANLIGNALKFNVDRGDVQVTVSRETPLPDGAAGGGALVLLVRDDGVGFDPALAAQAFERFKRLPQGASALGHGLGLGIVRRAVERLGGHAQAQSRPGQGTTIRVVLGPGSDRST